MRNLIMLALIALSFAATTADAVAQMRKTCTTTCTNGNGGQVRSCTKSCY
jgi:hypothetical protein